MFACWRESSAGGGCEFYVHLNLVRSCEGPSDQTRCPLPPWAPSRPDRGLSCLARPSSALAALAIRAARAIRAQCVRLSRPCLDACGLARYLFLFACHPCGLLALPCLACILADSSMPCGFMLPSFALRFVSMLRSVAASPCLVRRLLHPCASLAGLALHYSGQTGLHALRLCLVNVSILVQLLIFPCESTTYRT